ncbi:MAG: PQQ-binding-like beta-propeller repeat protein [Hyphomonas sp.]|uniref:outer membrane protein assembly factor BamB family protein n=1 Tax=Hyphomonas sp. TaxID=87 RepID=UPI0017A0386E|nr:PQQ-binding-like beta-propeller repeat protein [Hyphomonas sp.]MBU3922395.1 PQQ-binding-like beta-propeller repeat protein [Alphaproteobacteria bacterium]MBA3066972.1 PQQ-binding-like beta-propeller repeat protein [Hyphomonas sp.]MBU4060524.1 PQQ-binding-like beta-propeller repeat protein [Alphaproteobacteria bacterium]MBU4165792.1 PQQ-binding-like beta-propeller repeat protein [Alphaproteobacteria bacterium]MBU4567523.1 PQQ-binding-like beta-propeller repeat protein [Alphaproteobacteria ba
MKFSRNAAAVTALASILTISACANLPSFGSEKKEAAAAEEKAGRITMVLDQERISPSTTLTGVAIELPEAAPVTAWTEAGGTSTKVVGHVIAAPKLDIAWRRSVGAGSSKKSALTTPPVTNDTLIFTLDAGQTVRASSLSNGSEVWTERLRGVSKRDKSALGGGLAVAGDTLIVASGYGYVAALNAATGDQKWRRDLGAPMTGSPTIDEGRVFVNSNNNEVFSLDLSNGDTIWSDQAISESARVLGSTSVAVVEDFVIAPFSSGEIIAYLAANGRRLWSDALTQAGRFTPISEINDIGSRPVLGAGLVFASSQSGTTAAIDGRSGARVWTQPVGSTRAPALVGRFLFVLGINNELTCLDAGTGEAYWVTQLRQFQNEKDKKKRISYSTPIVASGRVIVVSSRGELLAFSPQDGTQTGSLKLGDTVYIEPIAAQGRLYVLTDDAKLIAID